MFNILFHKKEFFESCLMTEKIRFKNGESEIKLYLGKTFVKQSRFSAKIIKIFKISFEIDGNQFADYVDNHLPIYQKRHGKFKISTRNMHE